MTTRRKKHDEGEEARQLHDTRPRAAHRNNGAAGEAGEATPEAGGGDKSAPMRRAEDMVDRMAQSAAHYAGWLGGKVMWLMSRAREEAEDIWAEAQAIRQQNRKAGGTESAGQQSSGEEE